MLFNSYIFIFFFLPLALAGFFLAGSLGRRAGGAWLVLASVVFYGWWNPRFIGLLIASVCFNYAAAEFIRATEQRPRMQSLGLSIAITADLAILIYYKYLVSMISVATGLGLLEDNPSNVYLPLGISFFTFTQIAYLVDMRQGVVKDRGFLNYILFVTFFPHLIAGPILHNREIMPQFGDAGTYRPSAENLAVGLSIFVFGLTKKCLLADPISTIIEPGFRSAHDLPMLSAWNVALCFSLQLYFDFSGYSDMAIGLARMFNIRFPLNFNSPYKATSIIDHWQRWHMTLSRYLALYIYNPIALAVTRWRAGRGLGIGRDAKATAGGFAAMVVLPTLVTMGLSGVWHGAGLQFLIFGLLHGTYLVINHAYRIFFARAQIAGEERALTRCGSILLTYLAVLLASIFFRAPSVGSAFDLLAGMFGLHGVGAIALPVGSLGAFGRTLVEQNFAVPASVADFASDISHVAWIVCLYAIVWGMPNTQQIMRRFAPALGKIQNGPFERLAWQPTPRWALAIGAAACIGVLAIGGTSEFLYFQF